MPSHVALSEPRCEPRCEPHCLTDERLAELIDGRLSPEELSPIHRHAADCQDCRELLVAAAQGGLHSKASLKPPVTHY